MSNSKSPSDRSLATFSSWTVSKTDDDFRQLVGRGTLSRREIARECQFAESVLSQNPRVKKALRVLEDGLRERGVLPPLASVESDTSDTNQVQLLSPRKRSTTDTEPDRRLVEIELASVKAENDLLRQRLSKYESLHTALLLTGRVPR
jgi:hypothetical protein